MTTAPALEGYKITESLEIVTAEVVFGLSILSTIVVGFETDFSSGRDYSTNKLLRDARNVCLLELKKEAVSVQANAVIAVSMNYTELPFAGKRMLLLVASGTAVKIERIS